MLSQCELNVKLRLNKFSSNSVNPEVSGGEFGGFGNSEDSVDSEYLGIC